MAVLSWLFQVLIGNHEWMQRNEVTVAVGIERQIQQFEEQGQTVVLVGYRW